MATRKHIPKSVRFEVFKRDKFTCQYCGKKAPDIVLEIEHIKPVADGGTNEILNLVAACEACNSGKGSRSLTDGSAVEKARNQLEILQERREQIEMMMNWQSSLSDMANQETDVCVDAWQDIAPGFTPNDSGRSKLRRWIKAYGIAEVIESMNISSKYLVHEEGRVTQASWEEAFQKIETICKSRKMELENPRLAEAYHLRNIFGSMLRKKGKEMYGRDYALALQYIKLAQEAGYSFDQIAEELGQINAAWLVKDIFGGLNQ